MTVDASPPKASLHVIELVESYRRRIGNWKALVREYEGGRVKFYSQNIDASAGEIERLRRNIQDMEIVIEELDANGQAAEARGRPKGV
jgi:hypothetical protein